MYNSQGMRKILLTFISIALIIMLILGIDQVMNSPDDKKPPEDTPPIEYTIDSIRYDKREVEYGTFTTKSEEREYMDVVYTNDETDESFSKSFRKENITIGNETKIENNVGILATNYTILILTKDDFLEYFHEDHLDTNE